MTRVGIGSTSLLFAAACAILQSCDVRVPEGKYRCDELTSCPVDQQCREGVCYLKTSTSNDSLAAGDASRDSGTAVIDAAAPVADAAADGGITPPEAGRGGMGGTESAGTGGVSEAGQGGSDSGPVDSIACVLGEASLGTCVLR